MRYIILQNGDQIFADIKYNKSVCSATFPKEMKTTVFEFASSNPKVSGHTIENIVSLVIPANEITYISEEYKNDKYEIKYKKNEK